MDELNTFADIFKKWRGDKRHYRYPKHFWDEISQLAKMYPLEVIAQTLSINLVYLKQKLINYSESIKFVSLKITSSQTPISIEFLDRHFRQVIVRFEADYAQMVQLIRSLSGDQ